MSCFSPPFPRSFQSTFKLQVDSGKGKLAPGFDFEKIVKNMFTNQDRDGNGKVTAEEFKLEGPRGQRGTR